MYKFQAKAIFQFCRIVGKVVSWKEDEENKKLLK